MNEAGNHTDNRAETVPAGVRAFHQSQVGRVYFITEGEAVKIGFSIIPEKRLAELQAHTHRPMQLLTSFAGTMDDEACLHFHFKAHKIRGEWFRLEQPILDFLAEMEPHRSALEARTFTIRQALTKDEPPASRKPAPEFPRDPDKFEAWANRECVKWPGQLQVKAYNALQALRGQTFVSQDSVEQFERHYADYA